MVHGLAMQTARLIILLLALAWPAAGALFGRKTETRLLLAAESAKPGETVPAGVELRMAPGWHTFWRNSGDSGQATEIEWTLPPGVTAGEIQWPVPEKHTDEGLTTYIFHDEAVLLVPLKLAANVPPGPLEISAKIAWQECEKVCVKGTVTVRATLIIGDTSKPSAHAALLEAARKRLPAPEPAASSISSIKAAAGTAAAHWGKPASGNTRPLLIEWTTGLKNADFFPFEARGFTVQAPTETVSAGAKSQLRKTVEKSDGNWPAQVRGLLVGKTADGALVASEATLSVAGGTAAGTTSPDGKLSLLGALFGALLGGLILNVMPCVLPVISLKILGFVNQSKEASGRVRQLGLLYAAGVLVSFLVMAGFVIGVQQAGKLASWGMQFQNPVFLVAITTLVTLVALNLFGLFEVVLSGRAMGAAGGLAAKEGNSGAFFNGVLAVVLATPCTAPFLGAALGFAFAQPPALIVLIFLTVGVGLALPYVILAWSPGLMKFMPRPGAWMEKFKIAMGFPMLGTAIWLFSLAAPNFGKSGAFWLGIFLVLLALAVWIWGEFIQRGRRNRGLAAGVMLLSLGAAAYGLTQLKGDETWQPWSAEAVAKARAQGRPIFVDFTADWCAICQVNKRTSIDIPAVKAKLKEINAVVLIGDYTREDAAITAELKKFERAGVPLVLVYPKNSNAPPIVLPELLTPGIVLKALEEAAR